MSGYPWFITVGTFVLSSVVLAIAGPVLRRLGVVDIPNHRSSHTAPVLRGAGMALALAVLVVLIYVSFHGSRMDEKSLLTICLATATFASFVGAVEDVRGLEASYRLLAQVIIGTTASAILVAITGAGWWWIAVGAFVIASYINATNFMDGINGVSGLHGLVVGSVFALLGGLSSQGWLLLVGLLIAALFTAFLPWNLMTGKMFLGDAGSYLLGALIAVVAMAALLTGINPIAIVGPLLIYMADVGSTLVRRMRSGEKWTEAHRTHVYQRLTDQSLSHVAVSAIVSLFSLATGLAGLLAVGGGFIISASAVTIMLLFTVGYLLMPLMAKRRVDRLTKKVNYSP